ncbi:MAG: dihydroneopterin aldolase [Planctomycetaceae bacterium]|jgi:D-erythro-7,8-dihydroneopterin triphosphate epimerase|nr:dihydroneopterin aldolase [Planctomycetaceae bacterium]MBT6157909.1 dihydroneopterin aldolase [Planctomycetaceae bacterium]MBT6487435.1 dihydroneopterin aldolase [Planctomycetaceae bacterium]MBT6495590.1 dihydroneopterin aldolase [Planctomycetaceae bacterium]
MADQILVKDLFLRTIIGVNDDERSNRQDVLINLVLDVDTRAAGRSDDMNDTVNYRDIAKQVIELVEGSKFFLVEKLADEIARVCLSDQRVGQVQVSVEKPAALRFAKSVGVSIVRTRDDV